jgi:hypothetical protein
MIIPLKYQVFDTIVPYVDSKDVQRLRPYLTGYMRLAPLISTINESDLRILVVMELMGKQRWKLIDRLLMRLGKVQRKRIEQRITKCLRSK